MLKISVIRAAERKKVRAAQARIDPGLVQMQSLEAIEQEFRLIVSKLGFELVEVRGLQLGGRSVIRLFIHRAGGVTIGDCQTVSQAISDYLDTTEPIEGSYVLEVSSLGLDRPLLTKADFQRRLGEEIVLELRPGEKASITQGRLVAVDDIGVTIAGQGQQEVIAFERIARGKIVY